MVVMIVKVCWIYLCEGRMVDVMFMKICLS